MKKKVKDTKQIDTKIVDFDDKKTLHSIYKLRYQGFIIEEHIEPLNKYPNKELFDDYDKYGIHICSMCNNEVLGSVLIVLRKNTNKFAFEEIYKIDEIPQNSSELRRLVINSRFVKHYFLYRAEIIKNLMEKMKEVMINNEINYAYMVCRKKYLKMYKKIGFKEVKAAKKMKKNEGKYLMYIDFSENEPNEILGISKLEKKNDL